MKFLYARCSTKQQNEARQLAYAEEAGIEPRNVFIDKKSGKNADRPALKDLFSRLREGDELHITELSRLGRNTRDLLDLVGKLDALGVSLVSQRETIDTSTPTGRLVFHIFASIAEFQRDCINENAAAGREAAKEQGRPIGRPKVDQDALELALHMFRHDAGKSVAEICKKTGVGRSTLYRAAEERGIARAAK